jgi:hypothetical protein
MYFVVCFQADDTENAAAKFGNGTKPSLSVWSGVGARPSWLTSRSVDPVHFELALEDRIMSVRRERQKLVHVRHDAAIRY